MIPQPREVTPGTGSVTTSVDGVTSSMDLSLNRESYILDIGTARADGVHITGGSSAGVFYAFKTLLQLLPPCALRHSETSSKRRWEIPVQKIVDSPRFTWRGVMLDVARHFMPLPDLLRFVDLAASHKFNVLHLHLTDDQGWRLPVEKWPLLTKVACWRKRSMLGATMHNMYDARPHGGFYSKEDLQELVSFATARHITIVPEVDMPGHMQAAIAAYPELGNGEVVEVMEEWGISKHVLNMSDTALGFCKDALDTLCEIFPSSFIGIGGDECPHDEWKISPIVQKRIKDLGLPDESALHGWFVQQMATHLRSLNRRAYGWDEIMACGERVSADVLIAAWRGIEPTKIACQRGFEVVACPDITAYLDRRQSDHKDEPTPVGTILTVDDVYAFEPIPGGLTADERNRVIGAQANIWTEHMESAHRVDYMAYPRLCAFSEVVWGKNGGGKATKDFKTRLEEHYPRLDAWKVNYRHPEGPRPWDARPDAKGKPRTMEYRTGKQSRFIADLLQLGK